jgi:hypothetical protein
MKTDLPHHHDLTRPRQVVGSQHDAGAGPVMLDVGGEVGALVLLTSADLDGAEIEISPIGAPDRRQHVAVHRRCVAGGDVHAAVYPSLVRGTYQLWSATQVAALTVRIRGGHVTEASWPG